MDALHEMRKKKSCERNILQVVRFEKMPNRFKFYKATFNTYNKLRRLN